MNSSADDYIEESKNQFLLCEMNSEGKYIEAVLNSHTNCPLCLNWNGVSSDALEHHIRQKHLAFAVECNFDNKSGGYFQGVSSAVFVFLPNWARHYYV